MTTPSPDILLALWRQALTIEIGIGIKVAGDRRAISNLLYQARQDSGEQELWKIIMFLPAKSDEIFLCKKQVELPA